MKYRINQILLAGVLALSLSACATAPQEPLRGVTALTDHVTDRGQAFSLAYMPDAERVSLHVIWPNDYTYESGKPVASTLGVELISTGGAGERSAKQIKQDVTALGSGASIVATPEHIYGSFSASPETLDETLSILRDVITEPELSEARFSAIKDAKRKRVETQLDKRPALLSIAARQTLLGDSILTDYWNNIPIASVITALTLDDIKSWHQQTFTQQDVTVAVAGSITAEDAALVIDELLDGLPQSRSDVMPLAPPLNSGLTVLLHDESAPSTLIAVIGLLPASREGGEIADIVAVSALGSGQDNRLLKAATDMPDTTITASIANFSRTVRVFGINADVDNETASDTYRLIEETYKNFKQGDLDDQEVLFGVVPFVTSLQSSDKNPDLLAFGLGQLLLDELPQELLLTVMQDTLSLKAADINQRISSRYPSWNNMIKVVLSSDIDVIDADCVVEQVQEIAGCSISDSSASDSTEPDAIDTDLTGDEPPVKDP